MLYLLYVSVSVCVHVNLTLECILQFYVELLRHATHLCKVDGINESTQDKSECERNVEKRLGTGAQTMLSGRRRQTENSLPSDG